MHIITGILLSALVWNKSKNKYKKPKGFVNIIEVAHYIPGRVRYIIPVLANKKTSLRQTLTSINGINEVKLNPVSKSLIVLFDEDKINGELLTGVIIHILELEKEIEKPVTPGAVKNIRNLTDIANSALYESTDGFMDFYHSVPFLLIILGIYKLYKTPKLIAPGAVTLFWWAFTSLTRGPQSLPEGHGSAGPKGSKS